MAIDGVRDRLSAAGIATPMPLLSLLMRRDCNSFVDGAASCDVEPLLQSNCEHVHSSKTGY